MSTSKYGRSSSDSIASDQEHEKTILMGQYQGTATPSADSFDEGYASDPPSQNRWTEQMSRTRLRLEKTLHASQLQSVIQSFMLKLRKVMRSLPSNSRRAKLQQTIIPLLLFLLPSFVYKPTSRPRKANSFAYLDGLRGVAALFVMIHHYTCQFAPALLEGWGNDLSADGTNENRWFFQLPFFRVIHSGSFMVVLFFAISGCVLSLRCLRLAQNRKKSEFMSALASSVFKRWLRLHLPVIASMCIALFISRMEWWARLQPDWLAPPGAPTLNTTTVPTNLTILSPVTLTAVEVLEEGVSTGTKMLARSSVLAERKLRIKWDWTGAAKNESLTFQLTDFFFAAINVCDPFGNGQAPGLQAAGYNAGMILWTIPIEYFGSIVVYITLLGIAWTRTWVKLAILGFLICWCQFTVKWHLATFLNGTFIAELTLIKESRASERFELPLNDLPAGADEKPGPVNTIDMLLSKFSKTEVTTIFWILLFLTGIYIGSIPQINWGSSPGFITLRYLIPGWYFAKELFYPCLGASFIMFSITYSPHVQCLFLTPIAQYLGRISFSLYLLHTQIMCSLGIRVMSAAMNIVGGGETYFQFTLGLLLGGMVVLPTTFWVADVFCRGVDEKSVLFARWVAGKALVWA